MKFTKLAAGSITTIIALWIGMWVLKLLGVFLGGALAFLATLLGVVFVAVKIIFIILLVLFAVGIAYLVYSIFFKTKSTD